MAVVGVPEKEGTGGRGVEVLVGASFSLVEDWLLGGGSFASGRFCVSASGCAGGGVDATTSGSILEGKGAGRGSEGSGKSLCTICGRISHTATRKAKV